jgi:ADP-ribose pyrophosphatase YjhB (NUDIX family)
MVDKMAYGKMRRVCPACRFVQFIDPKVSVAVLAERDDQVLLIKRSMEPAPGSWCLPGGFMDMGETPQQTAMRECREETGLEVEITALIDVYYYENYRGSGVLIMYQGRVKGGTPQPADDAEAVGFFRPDNLPELIVFESNVAALQAWRVSKLSDDQDLSH